MKQLVVLLSTYNGQRYLNKQLNSLLTQSIINNMRIIVRDDGSTDGQTLSILRQYKNEGLIDLWERKNVGVIKSFFDPFYMRQMRIIMHSVIRMIFGCRLNWKKQ